MNKLVNARENENAQAPAISSAVAQSKHERDQAAGHGRCEPQSHPGPFVGRIMGWKFALQYLWYDHYWLRGVRLELSPSPVDSGGIGNEPFASAVLLV
jgi:hypothetical protein